MKESSQVGGKVSGRKCMRPGDSAALKIRGQIQFPLSPFPREACLLIRHSEPAQIQESIRPLSMENTTSIKDYTWHHLSLCCARWFSSTLGETLCLCAAGTLERKPTRIYFFPFMSIAILETMSVIICLKRFGRETRRWKRALNKPGYGQSCSWPFRYHLPVPCHTALTSQRSPFLPARSCRSS